MTKSRGLAAEEKKRALLRETLDRVGDKWTMLVLKTLDTDGVLRFTQLRERIGGVSQKMLTKTLRQLERDGLVTRRVHPVVPPHVDYDLTPLGSALAEAVCVLWEWVDGHLTEVEAARRAFDKRAQRAQDRIAGRALSSDAASPLAHFGLSRSGPIPAPKRRGPA
jgi:DNA-binding HxlR family transcriptional regulator